MLHTFRSCPVIYQHRVLHNTRTVVRSTASSHGCLRGRGTSKPPYTSKTIHRSVLVHAAQDQQRPSSPQGSGLFDSYDDITSPPELPEPEAALLLVACGIGLLTGGSIVAFNWVIHEIRDLTDLMLPVPVMPGARALAVPSAWPNLLAIPVLGALVVGVLRFVMDSLEAQQRVTQGQPSMMRRARSVALPFLKTSTAAITLGTGNSLGPEGPSVEIGRTMAKGLGSFLRSKDQHYTSLIAAGSAAGVAAGFNAPISGVFFAIESVLAKRPRDPLVEEEDEDSGLTVAMLLLSSVIAAIVSRAGLGSSPAFTVPDYQLQSLAELPLYTVLGALCGVTAVVFVVWSKISGEWFKSLRKNAESPVEDVLLPAIGGITTGTLALLFPEIMYQGFENVNKLLRLNGEYGAVLLIEIVAIKIFATGISKASGLVGGLYAPAIFLGAALGSAFSDFGHLVVDGIPGLAMSAPQAYALVGVAAMLAAICQVPLTAVLLLFELTQDYTIIAPTLGAVGISYWLSTLLRKMVLSPAGSVNGSTGTTGGAAAAGGGLPQPPPYAVPPSSAAAALLQQQQQQQMFPAALLGRLAPLPPPTDTDVLVPANGTTNGTPADTVHGGGTAGSVDYMTVQSVLQAQPSDSATSMVLRAFEQPQGEQALESNKSGDVGVAALAASLGDVRLADCVVLHGEMHVSDALVQLTMHDKVGLVVNKEGVVVGLVTAPMLMAATESSKVKVV